MKRRNFLVGVSALMMCVTMSFALNNDKQCSEVTKKNVQCKNTTNDESGKCYLHNPNYVKKTESTTVICSGTTKTGNNCKRKTKNQNFNIRLLNLILILMVRKFNFPVMMLLKM